MDLKEREILVENELFARINNYAVSKFEHFDNIKDIIKER